MLVRPVNCAPPRPAVVGPQASLDVFDDPVECKNYYGEPADDPGDCALSELDATHRAWLLDDALRLVTDFANSSTCYDLGNTMAAQLNEAYQTPYYFWDPKDGTVRGGDYHHPSATHPEQIHLAAGHDQYIPDVGEANFTQEGRHEFAHVMGYTDTGRVTAQTVATTWCGPGGSGGDPSDPKAPVHPTIVRHTFVNTMLWGDDGWVY